MLALLLAGYFGQMYMPPPKPKIVGIDLGKFLLVAVHFELRHNSFKILTLCLFS